MSSGDDCVLQPPQLDDREALALLIMSRLGSIPDPFGSLLPGQQGPFQGYSRPAAGPAKPRCRHAASCFP